MSNKLSCSPVLRLRKTKLRCLISSAASLAVLLCAPLLRASDAPAWMHAAVNAPIPAHDEKTAAVVLYAEDILSVQSNGKLKRTERRVYKILRPDGKDYGTVTADFDGETRITSLRGWCIPAQGKDYEVKDKDAIETALPGMEEGNLATDERLKILLIPASVPGNTVGYEIEQELRPYVLQDNWQFQQPIPTAEAKYTLQLPAGWEFKATFINHGDLAPLASGTNQWQWDVKDIPAIRPEDDMPPRLALAGQMLMALAPPSGSQVHGFQDWKDMGLWQTKLAQGRRDPSPEIKQKVAALTASAPATLAKMQALAKFVQADIRYVAIELGIGGFQPHPATDTLVHHYGDCKDKATLMSSMLHEIGVESYYIFINTERGGAAPERPAMLGWFNHAILAIKLPSDVNDPSVVATVVDPALGRLLIFDPTDDYTPFGQLRGPLQANYGLLVTGDGGQLLQLPTLKSAANGTRRTAKLTLAADGTLKGDFHETQVGDQAGARRAELRSVSKDADRIKPIESLAAQSLGTFRLTKASIENFSQMDRPFGYNYSLTAEGYAKAAGNLLVVRPRVLGSKSSALLETKEPRKYPVEFYGPRLDTDTFEITLPPGYEVDDLPPPVDVDYTFASYHSKTEVQGNVLRYTRSFDVKDVSVPVTQLNDLKRLYRIIASDERNTAVLKPSATQAAAAPKS
ncbi:MAG: DUF3857 and transglutaminase domain-containing protein [Candidatus Acidiferrum sp.]|jgi:hypothetical protein